MALVTLFRAVQVVVDAPSGATLTFYTDMPGMGLALRATGIIPATNGQQAYRLGLSGACKGKQYSVKIVPTGSGTAAVYEGQVHARTLGPQPTGWQWHTIPVLETPVEWQAVKLPIPETSDDWQALKLPIPQTPDDWQALKLPIPETSDQWSEMKLPVKPTPVVPEWVSVQVDA